MVVWVGEPVGDGWVDAGEDEGGVVVEGAVGTGWPAGLLAGFGFGAIVVVGCGAGVGAVVGVVGAAGGRRDAGAGRTRM